MAIRDLTKIFLRWTYLRAVFHRGYVLASGLYFVVNARLPAFQLVLLGTVMSATAALERARGEHAQRKREAESRTVTRQALAGS